MGGAKGLDALRRSTTEHNIRYRGQVDVNWPKAHTKQFEAIQAVGQIKFAQYAAELSANEAENVDKPWKLTTKDRASWIAQRADLLMRNQANEDEWRMAIEDHVLKRFLIEVNCPACRRRLWISEVDSIPPDTNHRVWDELIQRRAERKPCNCPSRQQSQEVYGSGSNELFDSRVGRLVIHDDDEKDLPAQRPDRFFGLKATKRLDRILSRPSRSAPSGEILKYAIRTTVFEHQESPLLFPFLVLEAKADVAPCSFSDIQVQTAFPIRALLKLQENLKSTIPTNVAALDPLVWFLGYRGSRWEVYGCYSSTEEDKATYNIHCLWDGNITTPNGALQLLLILDLIMDWARDIFRATIIEQLKHLADIIDDTDSDIMSMRHSVYRGRSQTIPNCLSPTTPTAPQEGFSPTSAPDGDEAERAFEKSANVPPPKTRLGTVRYASTAVFRLVGLKINSDNIRELLDAGAQRTSTRSSDPRSLYGRMLLSLIVAWDEVLDVHASVLDYIENEWSSNPGFVGESTYTGIDKSYYAIFEYRCYLDMSWRIIRELSYVAVTKRALRELLKACQVATDGPVMEAFRRRARICRTSKIKAAIDCLRSGSTWQVLLSAISSTLFRLTPEPPLSPGREAKNKVTYIGLHPVRIPFIRQQMAMHLDLAEICDQGNLRTTFRQISERESMLSANDHEPQHCIRCRDSDHDLFRLDGWDNDKQPTLPAVGTILVASLREEEDEVDGRSRQRQHDLALFVVRVTPWQREDMWVRAMVHLHSLTADKPIYCAIRHGPVMVHHSMAAVWNTPWPYRIPTKYQTEDIGLWLHELRGENTSCLELTEPCVHPWPMEQMLFFHLERGMSYTDALIALQFYVDDIIQNTWVNATDADRERKWGTEQANCVELVDFWALHQSGIKRKRSQFPLKLREDSILEGLEEFEE